MQKVEQVTPQECCNDFLQVWKCSKYWNGNIWEQTKIAQSHKNVLPETHCKHSIGIRLVGGVHLLFILNRNRETVLKTRGQLKTGHIIG